MVAEYERPERRRAIRRNWVRFEHKLSFGFVYQINISGLAQDLRTDMASAVSTSSDSLF